MKFSKLYAVLFCTVQLSSISFAKTPLLLKDIAAENIYSEQQITRQLNAALNKTSNRLTDLQKEFLLNNKISLMVVEELSDSELIYLQQLTKYQSKAFKLHAEGPLPIKVFDISSMAKFKLQQYYTSQRLQQLKQLIKKNYHQYQSSLLSAKGGGELKAAIASVSQLSSEQAKLLAQSIPSKQSLAEPLLIALVRKSNDKVLYLDVLKNISSANAHQMLLDIKHKFQETEQEFLLKSVVKHNPYLASQALLQYGDLSLAIQSNDFLISQLANKKLGASAAVVIANSGQDKLFIEMAKLASTATAGRTTVGNALLSLRLTNSQFARQQLRSIVDSKAIAYQDMLEEISKWLN